MNPIRNKNDLFCEIERVCTSSACRRAMQRHGGLLLGGFEPLSPSTFPGWVVLVKSVTDRVWTIGVVADTVRHTLRYMELDRIPWETWNPRDKTGSLYAGDIYGTARLQRLNSLRGHCYAKHTKANSGWGLRFGRDDMRWRPTITSDDLQLGEEGVADTGE